MEKATNILKKYVYTKGTVSNCMKDVFNMCQMLSIIGAHESEKELLSDIFVAFENQRKRHLTQRASDAGDSGENN